MVSKKDVNSAELETMRTSRSPTMVMTNHEVRTREEATVYITQLDLFVKVMLLDETPAVLSLAKLCEDHQYTYHWTSGEKPHPSGMEMKFIAIYPTMYHLWFLDYLRVVPHPHLHLRLHQLLHRSQYRPTEKTVMLKLQHQKEIEVRMETRCMNPQKPKTKIKISNLKKYKEMHRTNCLIGCRN